MSGSVAHDPVVSAALQLLPVPEHRPEFWPDLHALLDLEVAVASPATAGPVVVASPGLELALDPPLVPQSLRRPANAVLLSIAAVAALVVAVAGQSLLSSRTGTAGGRQASAAADIEALVDDARPDDSAPNPLAAADELAASEVVLAWLGALGQGAADDAWDMLGPASQAHVGSKSAFSVELAGLAADLAAWADPPPSQILVTPLGAGDAGTLAVVTLVGPDGARAFPVQLAGGRAWVEPFASRPGLELVAPEAAADATMVDPLARGTALLVVVPADAGAPLLRLDDHATVVCGEAEGSRLTTLDDGSARRCSYLPPGGIAAGEHTLTVAFLGTDKASMGARSVLFEAA